MLKLDYTAFVTLGVLKLNGVILWKWIWIFSPLFVPVVWNIVIFIIATLIDFNPSGKKKKLSTIK